MIATVVLVELVGYVVLLLWGMHMVQSGVVRAFGSDLRRAIGRTLRNRFAAVGAGLAVTALLQSSTATAMMTTSLAADGTVALAPALAVMLGANRDCLRSGGQAATAACGCGSLAGWKLCPKPEPSVPFIDGAANLEQKISLSSRPAHLRLQGAEWAKQMLSGLKGD